MKSDYKLSLNDDTFNALKSDFDITLRKTLENMTQKNGTVADIKLSLRIELQKKTLSYDPMLKMPPKERLEPSFQHKISSVMQIKNSAEGFLKGDYELLWDDKEECWVMRTIEDGQMRLFD